MPFITRPNFEDRQVVQYSGDTITLSGGTNINNLGSLQINAPILDFTGTTTASTIYNIAGVQGYVNYGQPSSFIIQPPIILQSGTTGTTTVDVTGYILGGMDSSGRVTWYPASYFLTGGTAGSGTTYVIIDFTGNTSASCITDLYVHNLYGCSPIMVHDVLSGSNTTSYLDLTSDDQTLSLYNNTTAFGGSVNYLKLGANAGIGTARLHGNGSYVDLGGGANIGAPTYVFISTNNGGVNAIYKDHGILITTPNGGSAKSAFVLKTNASAGSAMGGSGLQDGALQGELITGIPSTSAGLEPGVMGTGLGMVATGSTGGKEYLPVFISTPRSRAYDLNDYSTIKNVVFAGGSDNEALTGVTNSAIIGGEHNVLGVNGAGMGATRSVILGGNGITAIEDDTVYTPKLNASNHFIVNTLNSYGPNRPNYVSELIYSGNTTGGTYAIPIQAGWVIEDVMIYQKTVDTGGVVNFSMGTTGGVWSSSLASYIFVGNMTTLLGGGNKYNYFASPDTLTIYFNGTPPAPNPVPITDGEYKILIRYWNGTEVF